MLETHLHVEVAAFNRFLHVTAQTTWNNSRVYFIANVNSRSRSIYAVARPSVVCLSVCLVRPTQPVKIFRNIYTPFGTLAIR